jgi:2-methylisocitrate lyase-like PEP mutase family enzyme
MMHSPCDRKRITAKKAGADSIYPILMNDYDDISRFLEQVASPVNASKQVSDLKRLENRRVRVSLDLIT